MFVVILPKEANIHYLYSDHVMRHLCEIHSSKWLVCSVFHRVVSSIIKKKYMISTTDYKSFPLVGIDMYIYVGSQIALVFVRNSDTTWSHFILE